MLELENELQKERQKLGELRKKHYELAGVAEGWEEGGPLGGRGEGTAHVRRAFSDVTQRSALQAADCRLTTQSVFSLQLEYLQTQNCHKLW